MSSAGIDLSAVIAAACRCLGIEDKVLTLPFVFDFLNRFSSGSFLILTDN
jgi:hypothetical protein